MSSSDAPSQRSAVVAVARPRIVTRVGHAVIAALLAVALAGAVWHGARFVEHTETALAVPFPLDGLEGTLLHEAWLVRSGEPLYQPLQPDRFVSSPYQPLHYLLLSVVAPQQFVGPHVFFAGRLLSLAAMLLATLFLGLAVLRLSRSVAAAALAMGLWLAFPPVQLWATRIKPDPLALALTMGGLLAVTFYDDGASKGVRRFLPLGVALGCFIAAYFTKQTAVVAPAAVGLALLGSGIRRAVSETGSSRAFMTHRAIWVALSFGLLYLTLVGAIWLALDAITNGQYTFHVWGLHRSEWWSFTLMSKFLELLQPSWPLAALGLAGIALAVVLVLRRPVPSPLRLLPACYLLLAPLTLLGSGEIGANHNHLLETQLALTLLGCTVVGRWVRHETRDTRHETRGFGGVVLMVVGVGLLLAQVWTLRERPAWYGGQFAPLQDPPTRYIDFIRSQQGEVLADDVGLLVAAGRPLRYDDPSTMGPAVSSGVWDESTLLVEVAAQRFSAIMLPLGPKERIDAKGRWSPAFIATLHEYYKPLYRDRITTYVPK